MSWGPAQWPSHLRLLDRALRHSIQQVAIHHDGRYLVNHGKRVRNILKRESEFVIKDSTPDKIVDDLSALLDKETLFNTKDGA